MQVVIMILQMNVFLGTNPVVVFAEASIHMKCKIQTLCINSNTGVNFTPPQVMNLDLFSDGAAQVIVMEFTNLE